MVSLSDMNDPHIYQREKYSEDNGTPVFGTGWGKKPEAWNWCLGRWGWPERYIDVNDEGRA